MASHTDAFALRNASGSNREDIRGPRTYYIGVDVGTGSARACIIDESGDMVGHASEGIHQWQPEVNFHEQSTNDIWRNVCQAVRQAVQQSGIDNNSVRSIAFAATCSLAIFDHATDMPVAASPVRSEESDHNVILWMDSRAEVEAGFINRTGHYLLKYLGGTLSPQLELPKVLWMRRNMPRELFRKCKFYNLNDALTYIATGERSFPCTPACDHESSLALGVDGTIKGWERDFLVTIGLEDLADNDFKRVGGVCKHGRCPSAGTLVGQLCNSAAQDLALPTSVLVGSGLIDSYSGWVGTVGAKIETPEASDELPLYTRLAAVAGTSTCHTVVSKEPVFVNGIWGPYKDWIMPGFWMSEGGQNATGHLLQHVLEIHPAYNQASSLAMSGKQDIFEFLSGQLQKMQAETNAPNIAYLGRHLFFYGDLFGNRSPIADHMMSGSVVGVTGDKSLKSLVIQYYGALEFLALQTHQIISEMNNAGHCIRSIFMSGSQCQNDILVRLIATACNMPVITPKYIHAAVCYGAATLAVRAAATDDEGSTEDIWTVMQRLSQPGKLYLPSEDEDLKKLLAVKYEVFLEQCERQRVFRSMVDQVTIKTAKVAA